eukprot:TRINITY_DN738_c0_g1_i1.p1 TRINITY_DN738_c0_g1~~TRINITY_DN738_c0_g1_i1.p1  ORF type:complete len:486 (+),score=88.27 TRINITY_DN738_c0_g1_i1:73-1530(+)
MPNGSSHEIPRSFDINVSENTYREQLLSLAQQLQLNLSGESLAQHLDNADQLRSFRSEFLLPPSDPSDPQSPSSIYLCGHSLGAQPRTSLQYVQEEFAEWQRYGVKGHFEAKRPWVAINESLSKLCCGLFGAKEVEVVCMNSLTVNLHLMMVPFYRPTPTRHKILIEDHAFPSDHYAMSSQITYHGYDPKTSLLLAKPRQGEELLRNEDILELLEKEGDQIALVLLPGIQYYTGQLLDIATITKVAHEKGCKVGWDLAHAAGNVPLRLHDWDVDFAVWCSYKYLNSGPGGIGGLFIHEKFADDQTLHRFAGWWGHRKEDRFKMLPEFVGRPGAMGFQLSNVPVLTVVSHQASLEIFDRAGIENLRKKSYLLTAYLELMLDTMVPNHIEIITPRNPESRGAQLSVRLKLSESLSLHDLVEALNKKGVICDERHPNVVRIAPAPLYVSFQDVHRFVSLLKTLLEGAESHTQTSISTESRTQVSVEAL